MSRFKDIVPGEEFPVIDPLYSHVESDLAGETRTIYTHLRLKTDTLPPLGLRLYMPTAYETDFPIIEPFGPGTGRIFIESYNPADLMIAYGLADLSTDLQLGSYMAVIKEEFRERLALLSLNISIPSLGLSYRGIDAAPWLLGFGILKTPYFFRKGQQLQHHSQGAHIALPEDYQRLGLVQASFNVPDVKTTNGVPAAFRP